MYILTPDDILELIIVNGVLSIPNRRPVTIYDKPPSKPKSSKQDFPENHPLNKFKRSEITEEELCDAAGIDKNQLLPYLVQHRAVF